MLLQSALTPSLIGAGQPQFRTWLHDSLKRLTKRLYGIETLIGRSVIVMNSPGRSTLHGYAGTTLATTFQSLELARSLRGYLHILGEICA